ncbi:GTPase IMAP family member 4-like [Conger conger]|uniref:GTPase IMAP family member 4-like n=1 Tax=Conger conger TaxID=82655 RepID=UPI002A5A3469|nr:GTPase IMAP family member 4-like [Conger conger]
MESAPSETPSDADSAGVSADCAVPLDPPLAELRMVLLGKTGVGKSLAGNAILGRAAFRVDVSPRSVTGECQRQSGTLSGRVVTVTDTPGFFDTELSTREVLAEMGRCVVLSAPGPHAVLVVVQLGRFTQEDRDSLEWVRATFGGSTSAYTMVLFTWGDQLRGKSIEDFLKESEELMEFVASCGGGYHVFDNSGTDAGNQVTELLLKVERMVEGNGGGCYTNEMYREAERAIRQEQDRLRKERGAELSRKGEELRKSRVEDTERARQEMEERRREEERERKRAEKLFWCELVTAMGKGAAEGAGVSGKGGKKTKAVQKAAAIASTPLSLTSAAKVVGGAMREGCKVLYKHRKMLPH